jgi:hypothetical protein
VGRLILRFPEDAENDLWKLIMKIWRQSQVIGKNGNLSSRKPRFLEDHRARE